METCRIDRVHDIFDLQFVCGIFQRQQCVDRLLVSAACDKSKHIVACGSASCDEEERQRRS